MPRCQTKYHGTVEYDDFRIWRFPRGLFGFEEETRFLPLEQPGWRPLVFLQSLRTPSLCFISLPVMAVDPAYHLALSAEDLELLGFPGAVPAIGEDLLCLSLVSIQPGSTTANLLAPVVVNVRTSVAAQCILAEGEYSHQHPLPVDPQERICS